MYGFNPLIPLNLFALPGTSILKHKDRKYKVDFVKKLHEQVKIQIEKKNESNAKYANKDREKLVFKHRE